MELLDDARVARLASEFPEIADQLVTIFEESTPVLLAELRDAAGDPDPVVLERAAHRLKGACQNIGADRMAQLAARLERGSSERAELTSALEAAFAPTCVALRERLTQAA